MMARPILILATSLFPLAAHAHGDLHDAPTNTPQPRFEINAAASLSYFSEGAAADDGYWRIKGALMGGHALPVAQGAGLDDALIFGRYRFNQNWQVRAKIASHNEGDHSYNLSLDNLSLQRSQLFEQDLSFEFGLMDAAFSPSASTHASHARFAERALLADVFWGGSIHDTGLRLTWQPRPNWRVGSELWSGDFFPATQGDGAASLFVQTEQHWGDWTLKAGAWGLKSAAEQRSDERYSAGHSHSNIATEDLPDVRFTGDSTLSGAWLALDFPAWQQLQPSLRYEWAQTGSSGELFNLDAAQKADYENHYKGMLLEPAVQLGQHEFSYRYERLALANTLSGTAATAIATDAYLTNAHTPERHTVQWAWQFNPKLATRLAYTHDQTQADAEQRWMLGVVWRDGK